MRDSRYLPWSVNADYTYTLSPKVMVDLVVQTFRPVASSFFIRPHRCCLRAMSDGDGLHPHDPERRRHRRHASFSSSRSSLVSSLFVSDNDSSYTYQVRPFAMALITPLFGCVQTV